MYRLTPLTFVASLLAWFLPDVALSQALQGFSYGSTNPDGSCRGYSEFVSLFTRAKQLAGTGGAFTAAHLYTSIQCGTAAEPIEAFRAAVDTDTKLLVGLWASAGQAVYENELKALSAASRASYGAKLAGRVVAISVGSEDLYRSSPEGVANGEGAGATAAEIQGYIGRLRDWSRGTPLEGKPVTHADTWSAWVLPENRGVAQAVDVLSHNSFPYFEDKHPNSIDKGADNFWSAVAATESVAQGKPVWITETGWPDSGPKRGDAVASIDNAKRYWKTVGCALFGKRNTFWYTLADVNAAQQQISFGVTPVGSAIPKYDLTC
ncbi:GPI-anchored cell wall beta-1,3-endoglucanase EglC [Xylariaceae sp. FL0594]|nr:GPI-anchored cell wall beta-1,3-endoglucanase EglC [Xylariaceae sp. FL0594]